MATEAGMRAYCGQMWAVLRALYSGIALEVHTSCFATSSLLGLDVHLVGWDVLSGCCLLSCNGRAQLVDRAALCAPSTLLAGLDQQDLIRQLDLSPYNNTAFEVHPASTQPFHT